MNKLWLFGLVFIFLAVPVLGTTYNVEIYQRNYDDYQASSPNNFPAQTFQANKTFNLSMIGYNVKVKNNPSGNLRIGLYGVNEADGKPTATVYAIGTEHDLDTYYNSSFTWYNDTLNQSYQLEEGHNYSIIWYMDNTADHDANDRMESSWQTGNPYSGGQVWAGTFGSWASGATLDMAFELYSNESSGTPPPVVSNVTITLTDADDGSSITTFNATINGTTYSTTTGTITLPFYDNVTRIVNISLQASGYYDNVTTNYNISASLAGTMLSYRTIEVTNAYNDSTISSFIGVVRTQRLALANTGSSYDGGYMNYYRNYTNSNYYAHETLIEGTFDSVFVNNLDCEAQNPFMIRVRDAGNPTTVLQCYNGTDWATIQNIDDDQQNSLTVTNGEGITTTNGTVYLSNSTILDGLWNVSIYADTYMSRYFSNQNLSLNLSTTMWQALLNVNATEYLTGRELQGNYTSGTKTNYTNQTMKVNSGNLSITFHNASRAFNKTITTTIIANQTNYVTVPNVHTTTMNVTLTDSLTGAAITDFNITIYENTYGLVFNDTGSGGVSQTNLSVNLTYYVNISANGYADTIPQAIAITPDTLYYQYDVSTSTVSVCNTSMNTSLIMSLFFEDSPGVSFYGDAEILVSYWVTGGDTQYVNLTYDNETNFSICTVGGPFQADIYAQYDVEGGFVHRYYAQNMTLNATEQYVNIYNFNYTTGISDLVLTLRDEEDYTLKPDILVKFQRYYVGENAWRTVQMGKSTDFGTVYFHVIEEEHDYRIIFLDSNNHVLKTTNSLAFKCTDSLCELTQILADYGGGASSTTLSVSSSYNNETGIVTTSWNDIAGIEYTMRSIVAKVVPSGMITICDQSTLSASGSHTCNVTSYTGTIRVTITSSRSPIVPQLTEFLYKLSATGLSNVLDRQDSAFTTFIVTGTIGLAAAAHPIGAILGTIVGLLVTLWMGTLSAFTGAVFIVVAVLGLIIGLKVRPK